MIPWHQVQELLSDYFLDKNFVFHFYEDNDTMFHSFIIVLYIIKARTNVDESPNVIEHVTYHAISGSIYVARILNLHNGTFIHKIGNFESFKCLTIDASLQYQKSLYDCFMHNHFDEELYIGEKIEYDSNGKVILMTQYKGNGKKEQIYYDSNMILKQNLLNRKFSGEQICEFTNGDRVCINYNTSVYDFTSNYFSISCPNIQMGEFIIKNSQGQKNIKFIVSNKHWRFIHLQVMVQ